MPRTGSARGPYAKTRARREKILHAAMTVFAERGVAGGSIREIAEHAGLSDAGVLHHFSSKDELLLEAMRNHDACTRSARAADDASGVAALDAYVSAADDAAAGSGEERAFALCRLEARAPGHVAHEFFRERECSILAELTTVYRGIEVAGRLRAGVRAEQAARVTLAIIDGMPFQASLEENLGGAGDALRVFIASIVHPAGCASRAERHRPPSGA